jgi:aminoglycoside phosphotransferase (APT) family kinase protein
MAPARCWIHGDFHADQLTRHEGGLRLLDGDDLRPGAAEEDLANWIADRLAQDPEMDMQSAADELFAGYGAGPDRLDLALLRALSVEELLNRAAAGLRRLEVRAEERARGLVERAHACASETLKA